MGELKTSRDFLLHLGGQIVTTALTGRVSIIVQSLSLSVMMFDKFLRDWMGT